MRLLLLTLVLILGLPVAAVATDSDGDGLRDGFERRYGVTDPELRDSDGDGVIDSAEDDDGDGLSNLGEQRFGTDPGVRDTDGDGIPDGREDSDGDGRSNARQQDQRPVPARLRPSLAKAADDIWSHAPRCGVRSASTIVNRCEFGDPDGAVSIVFFGDSKATMYLGPAIEAAEAEGWRLTSLVKGTCSPVLGTMNGHQHSMDHGASCRAWRKNALAWLQEEPPDVVVLVFSDDYSLVDPRGRTIPRGQRAEVWRSGVSRTVAALPEAAEVVLLADAPGNRDNPVKCLRENPQSMARCVTRVVPESARRIDAALREAAAESGAQYRTLEPRICPYKPCPVVQGDVLIYRDKGHLTATFTQLLAPSLRAELVAALAERDPACAPVDEVSHASPEPPPSPSASPSRSAPPSAATPEPCASSS